MPEPLLTHQGFGPDHRYITADRMRRECHDLLNLSDILHSALFPIFINMPISQLAYKMRSNSERPSENF